MKRREFVQRMAGAAALVAAGFGPSAIPASRRPNIVLILADDLGFSDVGCYGGEVQTPNLDRLAAGGMRFSQFYNAARCCPTRASLLTGLYPHQTGIGYMTNDGNVVSPGYIGELSSRCITIAEALRRRGYRTAMSGKWHVSHLTVSGKKQVNFESDEPFWDTKATWPLKRGFDDFYGTIAALGNFYDPFSLVRGDTVIRPDSNPFYYTDAITDHAASCIGKAASDQKPFFLYVAYTAPHWPLHAIEEDIAKYRNRFSGGWDRLREERYRRMIGMGLIDAKWPLTPRDPRVGPWEKASHPKWEAHRMAVYAAMIDRMDHGIGKIMRTLEAQGIEKNTLVLFLSDNGGCAENVQPQWYDIPSKTRRGESIRVGNDDPAVFAGPENTWQSYGEAWANVSNTPFRLYKHWIHEGGIATPLIAYWPDVVCGGGTVSHEPGHVVDIMATCLDAAGADYPEKYNGNALLPLEGKSLVPLLRGGKRQPHDALYWEHEGNRAVRAGKWKLVSRRPTPWKFPGEKPGPWELYDMETDRTEMNNLAEKYPDRAKEMAALYDAWAARSGVLDWDQYLDIRNKRRTSGE